jgi:hypothetical protein
MSYKIIVARYNESLDWLKYPNAIIYNKGPTLFDNATSQNKIIELPNIGREGHTYLTYIIDNYDTLPDYVVFFQGDPIFHCRQLDERLTKALKEISERSAKDFIPMTDVWHTATLDGCQGHPGLPIREVFARLFGPPPDEKTFGFGSGAQFIVSSKLIKTRSKEFYEKVRKLLAYTVNPIEGYVIERFWPTIFGVNPE